MIKIVDDLSPVYLKRRLAHLGFRFVLSVVTMAILNFFAKTIDKTTYIGL